MARVKRNQNSKLSPATTNVGDMFAAIASHEVVASPQEVNAAELFQQAKTKDYNERIRRNRANKEYPYQNGSVIVQYSWDGTPDTIFVYSVITEYTKNLIFNPCLDLKKIPSFLHNIIGHDLRKCYFNRETQTIERVKQTRFVIG